MQGNVELYSFEFRSESLLASLEETDVVRYAGKKREGRGQVRKEGMVGVSGQRKGSNLISR